MVSARRHGVRAGYLVKVPPSLVEVESSSVSRDWGEIVRDEHGAEYCNIDEHQQDRCRNCVEGKDGRYAVANAHGVNSTHNGHPNNTLRRRNYPPVDRLNHRLVLVMTVRLIEIMLIRRSFSGPAFNPTLSRLLAAAILAPSTVSARAHETRFGYFHTICGYNCYVWDQPQPLKGK